MTFTPEQLREIHWAVTYAYDILHAKIESVAADLKMEPSPELRHKVKVLGSIYNKLMEYHADEATRLL